MARMRITVSNAPGTDWWLVRNLKTTRWTTLKCVSILHRVYHSSYIIQPERRQIVGNKFVKYIEEKRSRKEKKE